MDITEEKTVFCSQCGKPNTDHIKCYACGSNIYGKHSPFLHFLIKHTKEKFKGDLDDKALKIIKDFILSHLYGTIMSVTIVTSVVAMVSGFGLPSHITKVYGGVNHVLKHSGPVVTLLSDGEYEEIRTLVNNYTTSADNRLGVPYIIKHNRTLESMLAEKTGKFPFNGVHEVMERGLATVLPWHDENMDPFSKSHFGHILVNEQLTSELAITLRDAGYRVGENIKDFWGYNDGRPDDIMGADLGPCDVARYVKFVYVEIDGKWYIAEDRIFEGEAQS